MTADIVRDQRRVGDEPALHQIAADVADQLMFLWRLHAFRDYFDAERMRDLADRIDEEVLFRCLVELADEIPVDLDEVRIDFVEHLQARLPDAEVVNRQFEPGIAHALQLLCKLRQVEVPAALRNLNTDVLRIELGFVRQAVQLTDDRLAQLYRVLIEVDEQQGIVIGIDAWEVCGRLAQQNAIEFLADPEQLGELQEFGRRLGIEPLEVAYQRFAAKQLTRLDIDDRLVGNLQLAIGRCEKFR